MQVKITRCFKKPAHFLTFPLSRLLALPVSAVQILRLFPEQNEFLIQSAHLLLVALLLSGGERRQLLKDLPPPT